MKTINDLLKLTKSKKDIGSRRLDVINNVQLLDIQKSTPITLGGATLIEAVTSKGYTLSMLLSGGNQSNNESFARGVKCVCSCSDFQYRFKQPNHDHQCLRGDFEKTSNPSTNHEPGMCKHLLKLIEDV